MWGADISWYGTIQDRDITHQSSRVRPALRIYFIPPQTRAADCSARFKFNQRKVKFSQIFIMFCYQGCRQFFAAHSLLSGLDGWRTQFEGSAPLSLSNCMVCTSCWCLILVTSCCCFRSTRVNKPNKPVHVSGNCLQSSCSTNFMNKKSPWINWILTKYLS